VTSENHYCIGLKGNQPKLLEQAQLAAQHQIPLSQYQYNDTSHGRQVERHIQVFAAPAELATEWVGLAAFVSVRRWGHRDGKDFDHQAWFILSDVIPATRVASFIQEHRGASENKVHWVKDAVQGEDASLIQANQPAIVMAYLRSWAISAFRQAGHQSITKAMRLFKHDIPKLLSFL
jgi:hypothetical protein